MGLTNGDWDGPATDNLLGTTTFTGNIPAGQTQTVQIPVSGNVLFYGNLIHVLSSTAAELLRKRAWVVPALMSKGYTVLEA